jgi:DNA-binding transcriptional regulator PaaX
MARTLNKQSTEILSGVEGTPWISTKELYSAAKTKVPYKDFYNNIFRLISLGLLERNENNKGIVLALSEDGKKALSRLHPKKDGIWKVVIFDIPEKQKKVRVVLRAKLKQLNFKKWQNSIWISPFILDKEIENELFELGKKYFVRLIRTTNINHGEDLEKLFD